MAAQAAAPPRFTLNAIYRITNSAGEVEEAAQYNGIVNGFHQFTRNGGIGGLIFFEDEYPEGVTFEKPIIQKLFPEGGRRKQRRRSLRKTRRRRSRHTRRRK
jgi:hypothetical protein